MEKLRPPIRAELTGGSLYLRFNLYAVINRFRTVRTTSMIFVKEYFTFYWLHHILIFP